MRLSQAEAQARFASAQVARLATVRDGEPRIVPIVFVLTDNTIYTAVDSKPKSTRALRRLDDIQASPSVCVLADQYDDDWTHPWWVRADGVARVLDDSNGSGSAIDSLAAKYPQYRQARPAGPVIAIDVHRWTGWAAAG